MATTTPTTMVGNTERIRVTSGASPSVMAQYTSAIKGIPPGPKAASVVATKEMTKGLGTWDSRNPLPQRPPQACSAVQIAMPIRVMASMLCVPSASSPAARVATST